MKKDKGLQIIIYNIISLVAFVGLFLMQVPFHIQLGGFIFMEVGVILALVHIWKNGIKIFLRVQ